MNAWQADQNAGHSTFIPDGNGEFTKGMSMLVEKTELGIGPRSGRYSMLVRDHCIRYEKISFGKNATSVSLRAMTDRALLQ